MDAHLLWQAACTQRRNTLVLFALGDELKATNRYTWPGDGCAGAATPSRPGLFDTDLLKRGVRDVDAVFLGHTLNTREKLECLSDLYRIGVLADDVLLVGAHDRRHTWANDSVDTAAAVFMQALRVRYPEAAGICVKCTAGWVSLHSTQKPPSAEERRTQRITV